MTVILVKVSIKYIIMCLE